MLFSLLDIMHLSCLSSLDYTLSNRKRKTDICAPTGFCLVFSCTSPPARPLIVLCCCLSNRRRLKQKPAADAAVDVRVCMYHG